MTGTELSFDARWLKPVATILLLALFWSWETLQPYFQTPRQRLRHAGRNVSIALVNTVVLALLFGTVTLVVVEWGERSRFGLLRALEMPWGLRLLLAVLLLDLWLYLWHRANHAVPLLWRFHRMHHSDPEMDVTTATRFHLGEHLAGSTLRLGLIPLLGLEILHLLVYETLVVAVTMFHHANIALGRRDRWLRAIIVTPDMHKVHHSRWRRETDSNYSTLFSFWDRLFRSFRMRNDCSTIELGLDEFDAPRWQTVGGMLRTPFAPRTGPAPEPPEASEAAVENELPDAV